MKRAFALTGIIAIQMPNGECVHFIGYKHGMGVPDSFTNMPNDYRQIAWAIFRWYALAGYSPSLRSVRCYWKVAKLNAWATWKAMKDAKKNA